MRRVVAPLLIALIAACAPVEPLDTLRANAPLADIRADLLVSARTTYGQSALDRALAAPTYLIAKRFIGFAPPPPPGSGPDWRPPTPLALLMKDASGWKAMGVGGWHSVAPTLAQRLGSLIASRRFRDEPAFVAACPDFGAQNLLLNTPDAPETVRNTQCISAAGEVVEAALGA